MIIETKSTRSPRPLTDRDWEVLADLEDFQRRFTRMAAPLDIGGFDCSHHSPTLTKLCKRDLVERKRHYVGISGGHWRYGVTDAGREALKDRTGR